MGLLYLLYLLGPLLGRVGPGPNREVTGPGPSGSRRAVCRVVNPDGGRIAAEPGPRGDAGRCKVVSPSRGRGSGPCRGDVGQAHAGGDPGEVSESWESGQASNRLRDRREEQGLV